MPPLRLGLRLALELKRLGRPHAAGAEHGGHRPPPRHHDRRGQAGRGAWRAGGVIGGGAARRDGAVAGCASTSAGPAGAPGPRGRVEWTPPGAGELRAMQREADRILTTRADRAGAARHAHARLDAVLLHPVAGLLVLLADPVRDVPGGVHLGAAADGRDHRRVRRAGQPGRRNGCRPACCPASCATA